MRSSAVIVIVTGTVGSAVIDHLTRTGVPVIAASRNPPVSPPLGTRRRTSLCRNAPLLNRLLAASGLICAAAFFDPTL